MLFYQSVFFGKGFYIMDHGRKASYPIGGLSYLLVIGFT